MTIKLMTKKTNNNKQTKTIDSERFIIVNIFIADFQQTEKGLKDNSSNAYNLQHHNALTVKL